MKKFSEILPTLGEKIKVKVHDNPHIWIGKFQKMGDWFVLVYTPNWSQYNFIDLDKDEWEYEKTK